MPWCKVDDCYEPALIARISDLEKQVETLQKLECLADVAKKERIKVLESHVKMLRKFSQLALEIIDDSLEERAPRHSLGRLHAQLKTALIVTDLNPTRRCEWNPTENRETYNSDKNGCPNNATICLGRLGDWYLCESCAILPGFNVYKSRFPYPSELITTETKM